MTIREGDLQNTILKKISIDEFEPKTGSSDEVMVVGFHTNESAPGTDLYKFLNNSVIEIRDIEVSPNPNDDGYFMVFVEIDRKDGCLECVRSIAKEVENISGKLKWQVSTPLSEDLIDLSDDALQNFVQQDGKFLSKDDFFAQQEEAKQIELDAKLEEEKQSNSAKILEFLQDSNLLEAGIKDGKIHMRDARNVTSLEIVNFGNSTEIMKSLGIHESAIKVDYDKVQFAKFNSMLGEMRALPIDNYIVIYNPKHTDILVTKQC
jgi:copper chaperone CopZ